MNSPTPIKLVQIYFTHSMLVCFKKNFLINSLTIKFNYLSNLTTNKKYIYYKYTCILYNIYNSIYIYIYIYIINVFSAVKQLIASKIKVFIYLMCVYCVCVYLLCIYKDTHTAYILKIFTCMYVLYLYSYKVYNI